MQFNRSGKTSLGSLLIICFLGMVLVGTSLFGCSGVLSNVKYSDGYREGNLQKLSKRGFIWSTYDGELTLWGFGGSQGGKLGQDNMSNVWAFSLEDPGSPETEKFAQQINKYSLDAHKLRVEYTEYLGVLPWHGSSSYFAEKVTVINPDGSHVILERGKEPLMVNPK